MSGSAACITLARKSQPKTNSTKISQRTRKITVPAGPERMAKALECLRRASGVGRRTI